MGHTKPEDLQDLQSTLEELRSLPSIREKSKNIFYYKSIPFLHFHDKDGKRWADAKDGTDWGKPISIPFSCTEKQKKSFLKEVIRRYQKICSQ